MPNPNQTIVDVARRYRDVRETSPNRGPHLSDFWSATTIPNGDVDRYPWCSAFASFCVDQAAKENPQIDPGSLPHFPAVDEWLPWAEKGRLCHL